jgi:hypothetical protein
LFFPPFVLDNVIRETLKEKAIEEAKAARVPQVFAVGEPLPERQPTNVNKLLELAESHCGQLHKRVMQVIRQQLNSERFFQYDASLVRDGSKLAFLHVFIMSRMWCTRSLIFLYSL